MTGEHFAQLFGQMPDGAQLPVPPALADTITLITIAPRHSAMNHNPKVFHAAI